MSWDWEKLKEQQQAKSGIPPQMDDLVKHFKNIKLPGGPLLIILAVIAIFLGSSVFFTVQQDEVGVVQRFGKYVRTTQPGLNFKLPAGVENVNKVNVKQIKTEEFGFRSTRDSGRTRFSSSGDNANVSLMLTGDLNVGLVPWIVQYRIKNPYDYLFKVRDVRQLLIDMSEAAMRLVVGDRSINEVNQATQEKEQMIYQAKEDYNKAIPAARGEADRTIKAAEGYALDRVNRAQGDTARFVALYEEYAKAQDVTKRRLYLEMLKDVIPKLGPKYIVDSDQKNLLPLLNLGQQDGIIK